MFGPCSDAGAPDVFPCPAAFGRSPHDEDEPPCPAVFRRTRRRVLDASTGEEEEEAKEERPDGDDGSLESCSHVSPVEYIIKSPFAVVKEWKRHSTLHTLSMGHLADTKASWLLCRSQESDEERAGWGQ